MNKPCICPVSLQMNMQAKMSKNNGCPGLYNLILINSAHNRAYNSIHNLYRSSVEPKHYLNQHATISRAGNIYIHIEYTHTTAVQLDFNKTAIILTCKLERNR